MFENDKVYKIEIVENVFLEEVKKGDSYSIYVSGGKARFLKPRGHKVLFCHTLENVNYWLYNHCNIKQVETIEQWKERIA